MSLDTITLDDAQQLLTLPRTLGVLDGEEVTAQNGRYGPYVKRGTDSRSLETEDQLFTVTLDEAQALFAQPKTRGRRAAAAPPLREIGDDPATGKPMVVKDGRFGPYVTDGETNASLRRGDSVEELTVERAAELLADRRAAGPSKKAAQEGRGQEGAGQEDRGEEGGREDDGGKTAAKATAAKAAPKKAAAEKVAPGERGPDQSLVARSVVNSALRGQAAAAAARLPLRGGVEAVGRHDRVAPRVEPDQVRGEVRADADPVAGDRVDLRSRAVRRSGARWSLSHGAPSAVAARSAPTGAPSRRRRTSSSRWPPSAPRRRDGGSRRGRRSRRGTAQPSGVAPLGLAVGEIEQQVGDRPQAEDARCRTGARCCSP